MSSLNVRVALSDRPYDIEIGTGNLESAGAFLAARSKTRHVVLITDSNVEEPHAENLAASIVEAAPYAGVDLLVVEAGETSKSIETANFLWQKLLELGADRKTVVAALGGGVVGDLAGWVAASYARGLNFLQIPSSLMAQVDSSVGGKVGVNLPGAKNMVGAFWQPLGVVVDTELLGTLPDREYYSGLAEVVKYGVILDAEFFAYLETHVEDLLARDPAALRHIVARSCRLKADVVEKDEREETGLRAKLNYGHTFCHAWESLTNYSELLHGEAVSMGMHAAAQLARRLGRVDQAFVDRQANLLTALNLPLDAPRFSAEKMLELMARDKKAEAGKLVFILPDAIGNVETVRNVSSDDVKATLAAL